MLHVPLSKLTLKQAAMCFRKAGDKRAETVALARMQEENARRCSANGDQAGFKEHLEAAINHFIHVSMRTDASRCLVRMQAFSRAASVLFMPDAYIS